MFSGLSLTVWSVDGSILVALLVLCLPYAAGCCYLQWRHARDSQIAGLHIFRILSFVCGILIAALLLLSPVQTIARTQLFSVHMTQVVCLNTLSAPLILMGCPEDLFAPLLKIPVLRSGIQRLLSPIVASVIFNLSFLLWHTPRLYDWAMSGGPSSYDVMMLCLFGGSLLNWWPILGSVRAWRKISYPMQMLYTIFDGLPMDIFAFVMVYTGRPIYTLYHIPPQLNLSAFSDQAVAGALLLIPGLIDIIVLTPLFFHWLRELEVRTRLADERRAREREEEEEYGYDDDDVMVPGLSGGAYEH